jgi:hypothetical protein
MLNFIVGGLVALFFLGLPLAIIALFLAGSLETRPTAASERNRAAVNPSPALDRLAEERRYQRRRIIYGGHSAMATRLLSREGQVRFHRAEI